MEVIPNKIEAYFSVLSTQLNKGIYVWGCNGVNLSEIQDPVDFINRKEAGHNPTEALRQYNEKVNQGQYPIIAFDCSGFAFWGAMQVGLYGGDMSSAGLYRACTPLQKAELQRGDFAFFSADPSDETKISHCAPYYGDGKVLECYRTGGVVLRDMPQSYNFFGRYAPMQQPLGWCAKITDGFTLSDLQGKANVNKMQEAFENDGYTNSALSAVIGYFMGVTKLNPWKWEDDVYVDSSKAYGIYGFKPSTYYTDNANNLGNYAPNLEELYANRWVFLPTNQITDGAYSLDGIAQTRYFLANLSNNWNPDCWRTSWGEYSDHPDLSALRREVLNTYGDGTRLTVADFKNILSLRHAVFAFVACFNFYIEPSTDYSDKLQDANKVYEYILSNGSATPHKMPVWMMIRYRII